jgi:hypothetical protein
MRKTCVWLFAFLAVPFASDAQTAPRYSLYGRVVDGVTGQPLSGATVVLVKGWSELANPLVSGRNGEFTFNDLEPSGDYSLTVVIERETIRFHETSDGFWGTFRVGPERGQKEVLFPVMRHATISGFVRDEYGEPEFNCLVEIYHRFSNDGAIAFDRFLPSRTTYTDDRGHYDIRDLPSGDYSVCALTDASGFNGSTYANAPQPGIADFQARGELRFPTNSCYPAEPPASFRMEWSQHRDIDFTIHSLPAAPVRGRVTNAKGTGSVGVQLIREHTGQQTSIRADANGEFTAEFVEPGRYDIAAFGGNPGLVSPQRKLVVERDGASGVELSLQPSGKIDISLIGPVSVQKGSVLGWAALHAVDPPGSPVIRSIQVDRGPASLNQLQPGAYWLELGSYAPFCADSVKFDGHEVVQKMVTVTPGMAARLEVTYTQNCGAIEAQAMSRGKRAPFARYTLLLSGTAKSPGFVLDGLAGEDGEIDVSSLPSGRYLLWAWNSDDPSYLGPPSLAEVEKFATAVEVTRGRKTPAGTVRVLQEVER